MENVKRKTLESRLTRQNYKVIGDELRTMSSSDLLSLIDSKSIKIGDTAASLLATRREVPLIIEAVLNDRIRTALGRRRAMFILNCFGREFPEALDAYIHYLNDRSDGVVDNALFGIVFFRHRDLLPKLREYLASTDPASPRHQDFREAIAALEANNPSQYSPGYRDDRNIWRLNEEI